MTAETLLIATERVVPTPRTSAMQGRVRLVPAKAIWLTAHGVLALIALVFFPQIEAFFVFIVLTAVTICAGHSVGMHRLLIHRSFKTYRVIEYVLVWLGTLVGMAGPMGMIKAHDMRDWHQRQGRCPAHAAHDASFLKDAYWQLCCAFRLDHPPMFQIEPQIAQDRVYRWIERAWMWQQLPVAIVLYLLGGVAFVLWGISARIFVSLVGHWMVGHFAHRTGHQGWHVADVAVQGYDLPHVGLITFGESWHGNHHAFPYSAKLGVEPGQTDLGYQFIRALARFGLVWDIKLPGSEAERAGLTRVINTPSSEARPVKTLA